MKQLNQQNTFIEMCYTSNLQTKCIKSPEQFPIKTFLEAGIQVTINTDNMTVSHTTLKQEYHLLQKQFELGEGTLKQIAKNAASGAFVSKEERQQLLTMIDQHFETWLKSE